MPLRQVKGEGFPRCCLPSAKPPGGLGPLWFPWDLSLLRCSTPAPARRSQETVWVCCCLYCPGLSGFWDRSQTWLAHGGLRPCWESVPFAPSLQEGKRLFSDTHPNTAPLEIKQLKPRSSLKRGFQQTVGERCS